MRVNDNGTGPLPPPVTGDPVVDRVLTEVDHVDQDGAELADRVRALTEAHRALGERLSAPGPGPGAPGGG